MRGDAAARNVRCNRDRYSRGKGLDVDPRHDLIIMHIMDEERLALLAEIAKMELLVRHNPCGMSEMTFKALRHGLKALLGKDYHTDMSLEQVALYFGVTTRTINAWQHKHGFPKGKQIGHHELSFSAEDIIAWKEAHTDITN